MAQQDAEITEESPALAHWVLQDRETTKCISVDLPELGIELAEMTLDERRQANLHFLDGLYCTDAIFDEQKSRLETRWSR